MCGQGRLAGKALQNTMYMYIAPLCCCFFVVVFYFLAKTIVRHTTVLLVMSSQNLRLYTHEQDAECTQKGNCSNKEKIVTIQLAIQRVQ